MKMSFYIFPLLFLGFSTGSIAQNANEGVYLSANDFTNNKISFSHTVNDRKSAFHIHDFSFRSSIKIIRGNDEVRIRKDSIFGYRTKNNTSYRFYCKVAYKILNPSEEILLYSTTSLEGGLRNNHRVTNYFFSADASSPIYPLSKLNLKIVLNKAVFFHALLDVYFKSDDELTAYDGFNKIYLLNRVYDESKQALSKIN